MFSTHLEKKNFQEENFLSGKSKKQVFFNPLLLFDSMQLFNISISKTTCAYYKGHTDIVASVLKNIRKTQGT